MTDNNVIKLAQPETFIDSLTEILRSRARAPLRKISVSESMKVSGCASLMTLLSVMAYHSFSGEVEASNTPHDTPPYPFMPSPTSALSSGPQFKTDATSGEGFG